MTDTFMEFDASDEERLVRDSVRRMVQECRKPVLMQGEIVAPGTHAQAYFRDLQALGISELMMADGGVDIPTIRRIAIISEEAGAGLFITPIAESICLPLLSAAGLLRTDAASAPKGAVLAAMGEPFGAARSLPAASPDGDGRLRLTGKVRRIPFAPLADAFLVLASMKGAEQLLLVPATGKGVALCAEPMADGAARGELVFEGCAVPREFQLAQGEDARRGAELLLDVMLLSSAAQLAGIAARVQDIACEHIRTRHQFGRPLAAFQALQHRAANDYAGVAVTRAFLYQLCDFWDEEDKRRTLLHALTVKAAQTAIEVSKSAIQMHGAMGFTLEHEVGWHLKSAIALSTRYGDIATHRRLFGERDLAFW